MAVRLRKFNKHTWVALNALKSIPKEGDIFLDNDIDNALLNKFTREYNNIFSENRLPTNESLEEVEFVNREESNNENREDWDRRFGDLADVTKTVFIFGHLDLTQKEFDEHYRPFLDEHVDDPNYYFVFGDSVGCDVLTQYYMFNKIGTKSKRVTVFHSWDEPMHNLGNWKTIAGFTRSDDRDSCMQANSNVDLAWVRPGREKSGTARLLLAREDPDR